MDRRLACRGYTLVELLVAVAAFAIVVPAVTLVLVQVRQGMSADEASNQLLQTNQRALNRVHLALGQSKRLFQEDAVGSAFRARLDLSGCPPPAADGRLPVIESDGVLAPEAGPSDFRPASFGNSLLFVKSEGSREIEGLVDSLGNTETLRVDVYRFHYYYLTEENPRGLRNVPSYRLVEWKSGPYVDKSQVDAVLIGAVPDPFKHKNLVQALVTDPDAPVTYLLNTGAAAVTAAFHEMAADGSVSAEPDHVVAWEDCEPVTRMVTGLTGNTYRYGISPNSASWPDAPKVVPRFAAPNGAFPGGFEVGVVGPSGGRKVLLRSVLVAQGAFPHPRGNDLTLVTAVRDVW